MAIRALIFDFDGLILDTESPLYNSWMEIFEQHGLVVTQQQWASLLGASADVPEAYDLLEEHLGRPLDRDLLHKQRLSRELQLLDSESVLPGVRELIHEAKEAGLGLAVASSSDRAWVEGLLTKHGLIESFNTVVCAEDVAQTKPAPDLFLKALEHLNIEAHEAIVFEDSEHGAGAAKTAGVFCVAVPNEITKSLAFADADLIVTSIAEYSLRDYTERATSAQ
jgi:HAD superfamily hydrolase (TIGR01509 family)